MKPPFHAQFQPLRLLPAVAVSEARQGPHRKAGRAREAALAPGEEETPGLFWETMEGYKSWMVDETLENPDFDGIIHGLNPIHIYIYI